MGSDLYFYEQCETRKIPRRYRKLPEELPESLRFAHLNPKVAALLASKERGQRLDNEDPFGDGMGKKSLLPDINAAFTNVRNQFDSAMSNDEDSQRYLFEEAKRSSTHVLQQLSRIIYFYEDLYQHIPRSLEYHLMSGYEDFIKDIVVVPREWQTQEMKEQYANKIQQQEAISEEEGSDNELTGRSRSRLQSERSSEIGSKMNIRKGKPKLGLLDVTESIEPGSDSRLGKRSESRISLAASQLKGGHLDVGSISRVGSRRKGSSLSSHRSTTAMANPLSYMQTINFQLSNKSFEEKGWIMLKGRQEEVDQNTVLEYCITRLQESMKDIANQRQKNLDQGHDKTVVVRYYGDSRKETLLKYRKSPSKPTSSLSIQKGGKPRIPNITEECSEGKLLMQASHIDGSTVVYYPSGRPAILHSAAGFGRPGYYTIVYEDGLDSKMLACFTPSGRGVCYYENGVVRFLATEKGGHLTEKNGKLKKKWKWPHSNVKITDPICFQSLEKKGNAMFTKRKKKQQDKNPNPSNKSKSASSTSSTSTSLACQHTCTPIKISSHLMFRCVSQNQMTIVFSSQKETARFSVSPAPEADEYRPIEDTDQLLTAFTFSSKAAKDLMRIFAPKKQKKRSRKKKKEKQKEEREVQESESLKQVKFSGGLSNVPKVCTRFRRMSFSSGPTTEQIKPASLSPKAVSQVYMGGQSLRQHRQKNQDKKVPLQKRQAVTPDIMISSGVERNQITEINKRVKSARQVSTNETKDTLREKLLSGSNVKSTKSGLSDRCTKLQSESSEGPSDHVADTKETEISTVQNLKKLSSILKNRPTKSLNVLPTIDTDHKELRACKSAKVKSSVSAEEAEKRAHSAITYADQVADGNVTERQKQSRHKSSTSSIYFDKDAQMSLLSKNDLKSFDKETLDDKDGKVFPDRESSEKVIDETVKDGSVIQIPVLKVTFYDDDHDNDDYKLGNYIEEREVTEDTTEGMEERETNELDNEVKDGVSDESKSVVLESSLLKVPTCEDVDYYDGDISDNLIEHENEEKNDTEGIDEKGTDSNGKKESDIKDHEEVEEEDDILPETFTFRRQRGGYPDPIPKKDNSLSNEEKSNDSEASKPVEVDQAAPPRRKRRLSSVMKSIMLFRKKVLAKKGITLPSSSSETSDSDSDSESDDSQTSKSQTTEIIKLLQDFPERASYDIEAEKELAELQRKARNLVDDWMEHYRIALGLRSPLLQSVEDKPRYNTSQRNIKSARSSTHQLMIRKAVLGLDYEDTEDQSSAKKNRIPSAPLKGELQDEIDEELQQLIADKHQTVKFEDSGQAGGDGSLSPSLLTTINRLTDTASRRSVRSKTSSARSGSPSRSHHVAPSERVPSAVSGSHSFCPLVIRQQKLNYDRAQCRCSRHHIPFVMDIELDDFIDTETQESQLIVIMIVSSLKNIKNKVTNVDYDFYINKEGVPFHRVFPGITKAEEMLNDIYVNQNRNRTRPCVQSKTDLFRIFKYDINSAAEMSNHTQPLLMTRHNVVPGMFLIYCDGKLLFCDHIFNGYGNARKDFKKQIMKCRHDSIQGFYLPKDFRFSPSQGKSGLRSAWGGEIGGAGVDRYSSSGTVVDSLLQPIHRPTSTPTSSENSQPLPYDTVKSTNRRPFLPRIENQAGSGQIYHSDSISNWLSSSQPAGKTSTFSTTTTSYPNSLNELY